jgi:hypothetical protein
MTIGRARLAPNDSGATPAEAQLELLERTTMGIDCKLLVQDDLVELYAGERWSSPIAFRRSVRQD